MQREILFQLELFCGKKFWNGRKIFYNNFINNLMESRLKQYIFKINIMCLECVK